jgi:hypothetical protein
MLFTEIFNPHFVPTGRIISYAGIGFHSFNSYLYTLEGNVNNAV